MSKKPNPTLADSVYRASFRNQTNPGWKSNSEVRRSMEGARRFVADERMASFMAELANVSFLRAGKTSPLAMKIADSLRVQARLPHESIWIEYPLRAYQWRSNELQGLPQPAPHEVPLREGWLIQQHPKIETAHILHLFTESDEEDVQGFNMWSFPFAYAWCSDDSPLPWHVSVHAEKCHASSFIVGLGGYEQHNVACVRSSLIEDAQPTTPLALEAYRELFREWHGILRRVWALLATINDLPLSHGEVRQSKGFLARGRIRKFLSHKTLTLNIPAKQDTKVLARKAIAHAHRKRHEVRAHWRDDWRKPPSSKCNPHLWECVGDNADLIACEVCHGQQIYIHKHMRGDAGVGFVTHDYVLKHEEAQR